MKYINRRTGIVLEPRDPQVEAVIRASGLFDACPRENSGTKPPTTGETAGGRASGGARRSRSARGA